ncbi:endo alpha-1,4 polygalactosaminidase [Thalassolituus sp.]|jgi:hypothetical protein|uniref:endo alpha-1,4 polygalactosaminidase n=1 Tax=Thalassolituus sp. TaxID=2030822 RepID=UPI0032D8D5F4
MKQALTTIVGVFTLACTLTGCGAGGQDADSQATADDGAVLPVTLGEWYRPAAGTSWQWQLQGTLNSGYAVAIYDVDLFDSSTATIANLQASDVRVICYFSAGSYEEWRDDADQFVEADLGNPLDGWDGERWLDIRSDDVRTIMEARLDLASSKGCDGVEPDNVDGYTNNPGFALTSSQQLAYNRFLANAAHERGLAIGLKNDLAHVDDLIDYFDFAVNEECFEYDECDLLTPFINADKPVLHAEYDATLTSDNTARQSFCTQMNALGFSSLILPLDLDDSFRYSCL